MKVAICTPNFAGVAGRYANCLAQMLIHTAKERPDIELAYYSANGHLIPTRNTVVAGALKEGADFLLLIDADIIFPQRALLALLAHNLPAVACNYPVRRMPPIPTATNEAGGQVYTDDAKISARLIEPVAHVGLGFFLVSADLVRKIKGPFRPKPGNPYGLEEDVLFCEDIRRLGEQVHIDHALSAEIGHIAEVVFNYQSVRKPG